MRRAIGMKLFLSTMAVFITHSRAAGTRRQTRSFSRKDHFHLAVIKNLLKIDFRACLIGESCDFISDVFFYFFQDLEDNLIDFSNL